MMKNALELIATLALLLVETLQVACLTIQIKKCLIVEIFIAVRKTHLV